ncbi:PhzF family phenazine biosynthesis protein [Agarivorans sp. QJM3NY_29]|uniref:PhzF family phenazine biosynthesis protein n=1 Tax=unclassified Agarivorans TaxID=2636026 RepID=UPI003D7D7AFF
MELQIYQVDSFTQELFKGNPAGVCITDKPLDESLMFSIATEMAISETAFLSLNDMNLRWFTPKVEVKLCGHGTLAVAHILQQSGVAEIGQQLAFSTLSGTLLANIQPQHIAMDFPEPVLEMSPTVETQFLEYLGIRGEQILGMASFDDKLLIEIESEQQLLALQPNFEALKQLVGRGVLVTCHASRDDLDCISRYFAPWVGVNEDPVTGSAHCALAAYWGDKLSRTYLKAYQASERGGFVQLERLGKRRVSLIGNAVTSLTATLKL